jgi:hypothetical protein
MLVQNPANSTAMADRQGARAFFRSVREIVVLFRTGCRLAADARNGRQIKVEEMIRKASAHGMR